MPPVIFPLLPRSRRAAPHHFGTHIHTLEGTSKALQSLGQSKQYIFYGGEAAGVRPKPRQEEI
jgi:hypothetical protein